MASDSHTISVQYCTNRRIGNRKRGDSMDRHEQFLSYFLKHQVDLRAFIASMIRDRHLSEDLFQEVALILWREFEHYDPARPFGAWARGVASHRIMQSWQKSKRAMAPFSEEAVQAVVQAFNRSEVDTQEER